jgi:acetylornithine deacetylase/succinyl-diaminopimelate desuccinylase-like protein
MTNAHDYARSNAARFREQLKELIAIPSVSTLPECKSDMLKAAEWIADDMRRIGVNNVAILPTGGHPVVYGDWMGAGASAPTVLVYGHYDVQPADKGDGWDSDPFEPVERDGLIYARGSSDDKGQMFAQLKAIEALLASGGAPVNLKVLIEGEEEIGSMHLGDFVRANKERLKADVCVISDGGMQSIDRPSITYALRGLLAMELEVTGPSHDLHSGQYGGTVHNPAQALAEIVARLHNADGSVAVPGFYDDVLPLDAEERAELAKSAPTEADWRKATGAPQPWGEPGYKLHERTGARPTLEINGLYGGFTGAGFKTVLPAKAMAKISCRLVANQQTKRIFEQVKNYLTEITPPTVRIELRRHSAGEPANVDLKEPAMQAAVSAYEKGWGKRPIFTREGGSIAVVADFQRELGLPVIMMGYGLDNDGAHGPNEHYSIEMFHMGIDTAIYFHEEVGQLLGQASV